MTTQSFKESTQRPQILSVRKKLDDPINIHYNSYNYDYSRSFKMRTVQMTLENSLVEKVDQVSKILHTNRSAFTRQALREALARIRNSRLEQKHRNGYRERPVKRDEFENWEKEQVWDAE